MSRNERLHVLHRRLAGILLHPTSLPGRFGIGDLGPEACRFADFLAESRQGIWQVLPLGPTGFGDSPYQCFSAFAGNPLLVSPERLVEEGWLGAADLGGAPAFPAREVDFEAAKRFRRPLLERAFAGFEARANDEQRRAFEAFRRDNAAWLDDYSLFAALKDAHADRPWPEWDPPLARRAPRALEAARSEHARAIRACQFVQHLFFEQWAALRRYCHERRIAILGDMPIFVAHDSADVWAHRDLFHLDAAGAPRVVAGVPPDYFSATGQRWGNPLYRWGVLKRRGYAWWVERMRVLLGLVDLVRLDHFRGFEACWEVPGHEPTAQNGRWVKGPGAAFLRALRQELGDLPIVAENLGVITPEVERLRESFDLPGMAVLQFAFGDEGGASPFLPHNYERRLVVYTATHDNDTTQGWWSDHGGSASTLSREELERQRSHCRRYLGLRDDAEIHWALIRAALASTADTAILPLQDVLGLGSEARMNLPGRPEGNWRWRMEEGCLGREVRERLAALTTLFRRAPQPHAEGPRG